MNAFVRRNIKIFVRDKTSVFFSLFAVLIIVGLYVFFLGDVWSEGIPVENSRVLMDLWIMSGLMAVIPLTTIMGAFGIMVEDKHKKIQKDFYSSPISRTKLAGGYIIGAFFIGVVISVVAFAVMQVYLVSKGVPLPGLYDLAKVFALILLSALANTVMLFFVVSFLNTQSAFATASSVIGTLIGFLTGIYMPIGILPEAVKTVVKIFPPSHSAVLFRQLLMTDAIDDAFSLAPVEAKEEFMNTMGITLTRAGKAIPWYISIGFLCLTAVVFFVLTIISISRKKS